MKWAGYSCARKKYKKIFQKRLNCVKTYEVRGAWPSEMDNTLRYRIPELKLCNVLIKPTLKDIDAELNLGRALIIKYMWNAGGHYSLCIGKTKDKYLLVNDDGKPGRAVSEKSRKIMSQYLQYKNYWKVRNELPPLSDAFGYSVVWSVEPNE